MVIVLFRITVAGSQLIVILNLLQLLLLLLLRVWNLNPLVTLVLFLTADVDESLLDHLFVSEVHLCSV